MDGSFNDTFEHERPFWSPEEVSALLPPEQTARTVARWCKRNQVPGAKKLPNGRWVIPAAWVRQLLSNGGSIPEDASDSTPGTRSTRDAPLPGLEE